MSFFKTKEPDSDEILIAKFKHWMLQLKNTWKIYFLCLAGGAFGSLKGLLIVLVTMQGVGPWVESSPHWKQSKFVQILLPYAPLATEISKDAANQALHQMTSEGALLQRPSTEMDESERAAVDPRSDHSTKNPFY